MVAYARWDPFGRGSFDASSRAPIGIFGPLHRLISSHVCRRGSHAWVRVQFSASFEEVCDVSRGFMP